MTKRLTSSEVRGILDGSDFEQFIGAVEDEHLDFKGAPYPLKSDKGKRDLAQDVAEFANGGGGILVLGVETETPEAQHVDVAKALHLFAKSQVDEDQYYKVIASWLLPVPERIEVSWYPPLGGGVEGLAAVIVPDQPETLKPFIVKRAFAEETGKTAGAYVGYFERIRAGTAWRSPENLQQLMHDGRRFGSLDPRLDALTERVEKLGAVVDRLTAALERLAGHALPPVNAVVPRPQGPGVIDAGNRRGEAVRDMGLNEAPTYSLIAVPGERIEVPDLFAGIGSPLVRLLDQPYELRHAGFDVTVGTETRPVRGMLRRALSPGNKLLELWRDGVLIFAAEALDLLCWGTRSQEEPLVLNVLALAETTYLFAKLATKIAQHLQPSAETFQYVLGLQRLDITGKRAILHAGPRRARQYQPPHNMRRAPDSNHEIRLTLRAGLDPGIVAYALRRDLYAWFGFDEDAIPYVTELDQQKATDPRQIVEDGRGP